MVASTKSQKKLQQLLGVRSTKKTNGGHIQEAHCCVAGRALIVREVLYDHKAIKEVARKFDVHPKTVRRWVKRVAAGQSLEDGPRSGRPRTARTPEALKLTYDVVKKEKPCTNAQAIVKIQAASQGQVTVIQCRAAAHTVLNRVLFIE